MGLFNHVFFIATIMASNPVHFELLLLILSTSHLLTFPKAKQL